MSEIINIDINPVGIKVLKELGPDFDNVEIFDGISYCNAVMNAAMGKELIVKSDSIGVCQWAPVVLGFKNPDNNFEKSIEGRFSEIPAGIYIAPLSRYNSEFNPDVVNLRTNPENFKRIIDFLGWDSFIDPSPYGQDTTALHSFEQKPPSRTSLWMIRNINKALEKLNRFKLWQKITELLFKSTTITHLFDKFIKRYMADMSMCRNSTVIPMLFGKANISYFCTGGIAWGKNSSTNMTSGFPYELYQKLEKIINFPDKRKSV